MATTHKVLMFSGKFCAPCKVAFPVVKDFCEKHNITFEYHCVEDCEEEMLEMYEISAVPTFYLFSNDKVAKCIKGWQQMNSIEPFKEYFGV